MAIKSNLYCTAATAVLLSLLCMSTALSQLRVTNWNVTNYSLTLPSPRDGYFKTAIYGQYQGRSMAPGVLIGEEFISAGSVTGFLNLLNTAPNSPGDWAAAPFVDGPDTDSAFFYRTALVNFLGVTTVYSPSGSTSDQPRNTMRYDISLKGYSNGNAPVLALYSTHMKAGSTSSDQSRRLLEAQRIRADAQNLPDGWSFLVGGDFNIQSSTQSAYEELVESKPNNDGRFFDPIKSPGGWNNNSAFRFIHTQDPMGTGGMDDRHDQILLGGSLVDGEGFDYLGNSSISYSTTTWNDLNHSYRAWGNDGTSFDQNLTVAGNQMVGPTIAQALRDSTGNSNPNATGGHLPVFLDLVVPPELDVNTSSINFGDVVLNSAASRQYHVYNSVNTAVWNAAGVAALTYTMSATAGFTVPGGVFTDQAGGVMNTHSVTMDTSTYGAKSGSILVQPQTAGVNSRTITLAANVVPQPSNIIDKSLPDESYINIVDAVATVSWSNVFYIESTNRAAGIRVEKPAHGVGLGTAHVVGVLKTNSDGERYILASKAEGVGPGSVTALGMRNMTLVGSSWDPHNGAGSGQVGVSYGMGLNNVGLLARTWGKVISVDTSQIPLWFIIHDGSGHNVKAVVQAGMTIPTANSYVEVTGAVSCYKLGATVYPQIVVRSWRQLAPPAAS